ncbi:MAG: hypothetical protein SFV51_08915 [Bryobacteraceae bacterium]|nr:hypothetical protein [Bryobacteraceae bacterium]
MVEWNRDNVFEHPMFRNLPNGDLSGLVLTYDETRTNCIPLDSTLFPTVEWPFLRVWTEVGGVESFHRVPIAAHATAVEGAYSGAWAEFTLQGTVTAGDYVGLAWLDEQYNHEIMAGDTLEDAAEALAQAIDLLSPSVTATRTGTTIRLTSKVAEEGANGNRTGIYGFVSGARSEVWSPKSQTFQHGESPVKWRITLDFGDLRDENNVLVPTQNVRKLRWTYAADLQVGAYQRSEFEVRVSGWSVAGTGRAYEVAGPGSRRLEDDSKEVAYTGVWHPGKGNFSGGSIRFSVEPGASVSTQYLASSVHRLFLGSRRAQAGATIAVVVDGGAAQHFNLALAGEDILVRIPLGDLIAGEHSVTVTHTGAAGTYLYFDFFEVAIPSGELPEVEADSKVTLATDWDTDHSISLAPERTLWNIRKLGFMGRINHYVGALWYYELVRVGHQYASTTITFAGTPVFSQNTAIVINRDPPVTDTVLTHLNLIGETAEDIAKAFELRINGGYTGIRAESAGNVLTIYARAMGDEGESITVSANTGSSSFTATVSSTHLAGGEDGDWRTDLAASPRINRAARDWTKSFCAAAHGYGMDIVCAFSMELQHGDPSEAAGIAQRYPSGNPVTLNTPALHTNFSPTSLAFWRDVYRDMAGVMAEAGCVPYLQFGEVQWWYFPYDGSGLPFADTYTKDTFQAAYGFPIRAIANGYVDPALYPEEAAFLPSLIGAFTTAVMEYVRTTFPSCRFEVLYPPDVNEGAFNRLINYPAQWNPNVLDNLKTESFTYTLTRDLDKSWESMSVSAAKGFGSTKRSHLVGISDSVAPWLRETRMARGENMESIVLFALDQFCVSVRRIPVERCAKT